MHTEYTLNDANWIDIECTLNTHWMMHIECTLNDIEETLKRHWIVLEYTLNTHWMLTKVDQGWLNFTKVDQSWPRLNTLQKHYEIIASSKLFGLV